MWQTELLDVWDKICGVEFGRRVFTRVIGDGVRAGQSNTLRFLQDGSRTDSIRAWRQLRGGWNASPTEEVNDKLHEKYEMTFEILGPGEGQQKEVGVSNQVLQ